MKINNKHVYKQDFERTLINLQNYLKVVPNELFLESKNAADNQSFVKRAIKAIVYIRTQRARLATLAYVVRITCGQSELELITTNQKVMFYGFLDKCETVVNVLERKLERKCKLE